jgi:hypothetical protein
MVSLDEVIKYKYGTFNPEKMRFEFVVKYPYTDEEGGEIIGDAYYLTIDYIRQITDNQLASLTIERDIETVKAINGRIATIQNKKKE